MRPKLLEKGKWYKTSDQNKKWYLMKFGTEESCYYISEGYIDINGKFVDHGNFLKTANYIEVPLSEVTPYLPIGHPDKEIIDIKDIIKETLYGTE